jgi:hypothetical protein
MSVMPLTNKQLKQQAPSLFTQEPHFEVSDKYHFIPTIDVVEQIKQNNWYPVTVSQANVRDSAKESYQQHLVRFRHFDDLLHPQDNAVELLLFNSHDRTKSFTISAGIYRFVCSNGLVIADSVFESYKIKHIGEKESDVTNAIENITSVKSKLMERINHFESIDLTTHEKLSFASSAIPLRFDEHLEVDSNELLIPHRIEDEKDDLYTVMNVVQENLLRGNISGTNKETGRKFTSKEIKSINRDIEVNQGLWDIAERIASIKAPMAA